MVAGPSPAMSTADAETKCSRRRCRCAGQFIFGAANRGLVGFYLQGGAARRALGRKFIEFRSRRAPVELHRDDRRNDFAGLLHLDEIPHPHIAPRQRQPIVQGGSRHRAPAEFDRVEFRHGSQHSCAPHLNRDRPDMGHDALRLIFIGDRPARGVIVFSELGPRRDVVEFQDRAIDRITQSPALLTPAPRWRPSRHWRT